MVGLLSVTVLFAVSMATTVVPDAMPEPVTDVFTESRLAWFEGSVTVVALTGTVDAGNNCWRAGVGLLKVTLLLPPPAGVMLATVVFAGILTPVTSPPKTSVLACAFGRVVALLPLPTWAT